MEITIILIVVYIFFYFSSRKESNAFDEALKSRPKSKPYFFDDKESSRPKPTYKPTTYRNPFVLPKGTMPNFGNPLMSAEAKHQYLQSPEWKALKKLKLEQSNHKCQLCSSTSNLHLHHLTYDRLGNELLTDLTILCNHCHQLQHDHYGYDRLTDYSVLIKPKQV